MQTAIATCQHCGAQLEALPGATSVPCRYCKTVNQVAPRAPAGTPHVVIVSPPAPRAVGRLVGLLVVLGILAGLVPAVIALSAAVPSLPSLSSGAGLFAGSARWEGVHGAILTDLTGDGVPDLVGRLRDVLADDNVTIGAFDGASGAKLWESGALGTYTETYQGQLAFAEGLLIFVSAGGQVQTFAAGDEGRPRWRASLPDRARGFCQEAPGQLRVDVADGSAARFALADGGLAPTPSAAPACARVATDAPDGDLGYALSTRSISGEPVEGMRARTALHRDGGPRVFLGTRSSGTSVPTIGVVFDDAARSWKSDLAGTRPLETGPFAPEVGAVTADRVYTVYAFTDSQRPAMLVAFDLAGQRRWEAPLPTTMPLTSVHATDARVFVAQWGTLQAYDAATGAPAFSIGAP